jgi:cation:H+ antiporter
VRPGGVEEGIVMDWFLLVGGGLLLYFGAEWFIGGASTLALALRIPQLVVGLTVVAYGTSAPEVIVGVEAARGGHGAVALGNVIGSNVANVGLILATAVLIRPAKVDGSLRRRELPVLVLSASVVPLLLIDGIVGRTEGAVLLLGALAYTAWMIRSARTGSALADATKQAAVTSAATDAAGAPAAKKSVLLTVLTALFGLGVLLVGGRLFVEAAVRIAMNIGLSERLVGLTIVAIGTSLPELVTSVIAARRGHSDIAIGNVIGSNIFNILLCLGAAALAGSVGAPLATIALDVSALVLLTLLAAVFIRTERTVARWEGALALFAFIVYLAATITRG